MKKNLCIFNPRPGSMYVHLDQLLFDLKYDPSMIEIPVPRYFQEDDRIPIDIVFKEAVDRETKKKKGKKKKKKSKKKKKKGDDEEEKKEPKLHLDEKTQLMKQLFSKYNEYSAEPEEELVQDPFSLDIDIN